MTDVVRRFESRVSDSATSPGVQRNRIRASLRLVADAFDKVLPDGREKSLALTKLEEAMFWANASIGRNEDASEASSE